MLFSRLQGYVHVILDRISCPREKLSDIMDTYPIFVVLFDSPLELEIGATQLCSVTETAPKSPF